MLTPLVWQLQGSWSNTWEDFGNRQWFCMHFQCHGLLYDFSLLEGAEPFRAPDEGSRELAGRPWSLLVFGSKSTNLGLQLRRTASTTASPAVKKEKGQIDDEHTHASRARDLRKSD